MNLALLRFVVRNARKVSIVRKRYALHCGSVRMLHSNKDPSPNAGEKSKSDQAGVMSTIKDGLLSLWDMIINPRSTWQSLKDTLHHYWVGSKLLWSEVKLAKQILSRVVQGNGMTRRERMQLIRTTTDIFRLVPFAVFVIVPFMEFLLPFALRIFPNMLPSTFQV